MPNKELAEELYEPIIREFEKRKVYSSFIDNIWGPDLADMKLISKFNKGIHLLLCVIDIYSKYAWVIHLKGKKDAAIGNVSQKVLKESDGKQNGIWADKCNKFYNRSMKPWLQDNHTEIYSKYNDGKSVAAERFIITLKSKIYKHDFIIGNCVY